MVPQTSDAYKLEYFKNELRSLVATRQWDGTRKRKTPLPPSVDETVQHYLDTQKWSGWLSFFFASVFHLGVCKRLVKLDYSKVLHVFCRRYPNANLVDIVTTLCQLGADPNHLNKNGENALFAFMRNQTFWRENGSVSVAKVVAVLVSHRLNVNQLNGQKENALWPLLNQALIHCFCSVATILVTHGIDVNYCPPQKSGNALLAFIIKRGGCLYGEWPRVQGLVRLFVEHGVDVNATNHENDNILTIMAKHPYLSPDVGTVRYLIDRGLRVDHVDIYENNALHTLSLNAIGKNLKQVTELIKLLAQEGLDVTKADVVGDTALYNFLISIREVNSDALKLVTCLIASSPSLKHPASEICILLDDHEYMCLPKIYMFARHILSVAPSSGGQTLKNDLMRSLVGRLTKNTRCEDYCIYNGSVNYDYEFVKLLIDYGADVNAELVAKKATVLAELCERYHGASLPRLIELLLERGADPNVVVSRWGNCKTTLTDLLLANEVHGSEFRKSPLEYLTSLVKYGYFHAKREHRDIVLKLVVQQNGFNSIIGLVESRWLFRRKPTNCKKTNAVCASTQ